MSSLFKSFQKKGVALSLFCLALLFTGCLFSEDKNSDPKPLDLKGQNYVFALISDYVSGSYAALGLEGKLIADSIAPVNSDVAVKYRGGNDIFVINRFGRDNLQVIDRNSLKTVLPIQFPEKSNPQDVVAKNNLLYVSFYSSDSIGIYSQTDGSKKGVIDISSHADTVDHFAEATGELIIGNDLYVILQNLNTKAKGYPPLQSRLLKINLSDKSIQSLDLPYGNPLNLAYDSTANLLYLPCIGRSSNPDYTPFIDGALLRVDPSKMEIKDTVITETSLQAGLGEVSLSQGNVFMIISKSASYELTKINPVNKTTKTLATTSTYTSALAVDGISKTVYFGDAAKGLRLFDADTEAEKSTTNIKLKMPTIGLAIIR